MRKVLKRQHGLPKVLVALCVVTVAGLAAIGTSAGQTNKTVTIGLIGPLTGGLAADGLAMKRGAQLAIDEINAKGGVAGYKFKLKTGDTGDLKADLVASAIQRIAGDSNVGAIVTDYASATNFEINTMAQLKMPYIIGAGSVQTAAIISKKPSKYPTVWSIVPTYEAYGTELPKLVEKWAKQGIFKLRNRKAFVVTSDNLYSKGISEGLIKTLESMNWTIAGNETTPSGTPINDWGAVITKIRAADPDLVINTDYTPANEATFMSQFLQNPTKSIVFMQYGPSVPQFIELTKEKSTGVLYNLLGGPIESKTWKPAVTTTAKYKKRYNADPGVAGIHVYDEVYIYADALAKVKDPTKKLAIGAAIGKTNKDIGSGRLKFDPKTHLALQGNAFLPIQHLQIWDGKRYVVEPKKYAAVQFRLPPWMK